MYHKTDITDKHTQNKQHLNKDKSVCWKRYVKKKKGDDALRGRAVQGTTRKRERANNEVRASEVVLYKVVHTPQTKTQPNPKQDKALSTS